MKKYESIIANSNHCTIKIIHYPDDPATWIVRKLKKRILWKTCVLSKWFNLKSQAEKFARQLLSECDAS